MPAIHLHPPAVQLHPLVEFDPFEYRADAESRPSPRREDPAELWTGFWIGSLEDSGIEGLRPWPDTWVVPIEQLTNEALLAKVVAVHFGESDAEAFFATLPGPFDPKSGLNDEGESIEEYCEALRGGLGLGNGEGPLIAPECCGDLSHWRNWRNAVRVETESWQDLWIGHPSARVCRMNGVLFVQKVLESGEPDGPTHAVPPNELVDAAASARSVLERFAARLESVLTSPILDPLLSKRLARKLAGLAEFELD